MAEPSDDQAAPVPTDAPAPVPVLDYRSPDPVEPQPTRAPRAADAALLLFVAGWAGCCLSNAPGCLVGDVLPYLSLGALAASGVLRAVYLLMNRCWWIGASLVMLMVEIAAAAAAYSLGHMAGWVVGVAVGISLAGAAAAFTGALLRERATAWAGILVALHLATGLVLFTIRAGFK
jgi:hypothetical protein